MKRMPKSIMTVIAVSLLSTTPAWTEAQAAVSERAAAHVTVQASAVVDPDTSVQQEVEQAADEQAEVYYPSKQPEMSAKARETLNNLYQLVPELKTLKLEEKIYNSADEDHPATWHLFFSREQGAQGPYVYGRVSLADETGQILDLRIRRPQGDSDAFPSEEQAKAAAAAFMQKLFGKQFDHYQLDEQVHYLKVKGYEKNWILAKVVFNRLVNGIPLLNHGYEVVVDAEGRMTEVKALSEQLNDLALDLAAFPAPSKAKPVEEVERTYRELLDLELVYQAYGTELPSLFLDGENIPENPILTYLPQFAKDLDAIRGEPVNVSGYYNLQKPKNVTIQPQGKLLVVKDAKEAADLITKVIGIDMDGLMLLDAGGRYGGSDRYRYFSWKNVPTIDRPGREPMRHVQLFTDRETGQVLSFQIEDEERIGATPKISQEEAEKIAIQFVKKYVDAAAGELTLRIVYDSTDIPVLPDWVDTSKGNEKIYVVPIYRFVFSETHKGVPIMDRIYSVDIDSVSGTVSSFSFAPKWEGKLPFPDPGNVVSPQEAADAFLAAYPLRLVYLWPELGSQRAPKPLLLYHNGYSTLDGGYLDAISGKWVKPFANSQ